jgi:nitrogen fixation protein NifQ
VSPAGTTGLGLGTLIIHGEYASLLRDGDESGAGSDLLARIIATWSVGGGVLPDFLGLSPAAFHRLRARLFPRAEIGTRASSGSTVDPSRLPEREDLRALLLEHRGTNDELHEWMSDILVAGCMGSNHLWQDLGLWSRGDLSELMRCFFPGLAARNDRDMKWKKFLYKQLCLREGIYVCRAPSCEVCGDYARCFGPEV